MKNQFLKISTLLLGVTLLFGACEKEDKDDTTPDSSSAVLLSIQKLSPEGRQNYIGAFADVPTSMPDLSKMTETGENASAFTFEGFVHVVNWDSKSISKWEVASNLKLNKLSTLSFASTGIDYSPVCFASGTKAYLFDLVNGKIVEWNPKEMSITETITVTPTAYSYSNADKPRVYGNSILLSVSNVNYVGAGTLEDKTTVALYDMTSKTIQYKSIDKGVTTFGNIMTSDGMVYFSPIREQHYSILYDNTNNGLKNFGQMVRFNMNTKEFDTTFNVDLNKAVNGVVSQIFYLNDNEILVETIQNPLPTYTNIDNYFGAARAKLQKYNLKTGTVTAYTGVGENDLTWTNNVDFNINGNFYFLPSEFPNKGPEYYKQINTKVYKVNATDTQYLFTAENANIHTIQKIR